MSNSRHIIRWRYAFVGLQAAALAAFVGVFWLRSAPVSKAARPLDANHVLTAADVVSQPSEALIGQALRYPVRAGDRITADDVKPPPFNAASRTAGTVAALVTLAEDLATQRGLKPGAKVLVRRQALPDVPGSVIASACQNKACMLTVALDVMPVKEELSLQSFSTAELLPRP